MEPVKSSLLMNNMHFNKLHFARCGEKNTKEVEYKLSASIGSDNDNHYKVILILQGQKQDEYDVEIELEGHFTLEASADLSTEKKDILMKKNAVSILMPYIRSQLSLLTAQPGVDCQVLPPINVAKMFENAEKSE